MPRKLKTPKMPALSSPAELERAVTELQRAEIYRDGLVNQMEDELAEVRDRHSPGIADATADVEAERKMILEYLTFNKEDFEGPPRSMEFPAGTVGFRQGQKRLKTLSGWTWARVLEKVKALHVTEWLRETTELNRDAILADATDEAADPAAPLNQIGLKVAQDDAPYIAVNREETE
jgi:phage host-nuclease inhibitor protein Gam